MSKSLDKLKELADSRNRRAIRELERRGFRFGVHFGTENAADRLKRLDDSIREKRLFQHLREEFGIC